MAQVAWLDPFQPVSIKQRSLRGVIDVADCTNTESCLLKSRASKDSCRHTSSRHSCYAFEAFRAVTAAVHCMQGTYCALVTDVVHCMLGAFCCLSTKNSHAEATSVSQRVCWPTSCCMNVAAETMRLLAALLQCCNPVKLELIIGTSTVKC